MPVIRRPFPVSGPGSDLGCADRTLTQAVRLALTSDDGAELDVQDWDAVLERLWVHRLGGLVWPVLARRGPPPEAERWMRQYRSVTSRMNGGNLLAMRAILPRLDSEGVPALAFKGPVLQSLAYGDMFHRPASDLDLLVRPQDFGRAGRVLGQLQYRLADSCRTLWWTAGLGEQHYRSGPSGDTTIDLHHRVQQPGCPLPKHPEAFLDQRRTIVVAGQPVPTLSIVHTLLLSAMSCVKALHHREPAARYALDLAALGRGLDPEGWRRVNHEARRQGLRATLDLALRVARLLGGRDLLAAAAQTPVLTRTSDATLMQMALNPDAPGIDWPRRRSLLFALYDRKLEYPAGLAAMVGSDLLRQASERALSRPGRAAEPE